MGFLSGWIFLLLPIVAILNPVSPHWYLDVGFDLFMTYLGFRLYGRAAGEGALSGIADGVDALWQGGWRRTVDRKWDDNED